LQISVVTVTMYVLVSRLAFDG